MITHWRKILYSICVVTFWLIYIDEDDNRQKPIRLNETNYNNYIQMETYYTRYDLYAIPKIWSVAFCGATAYQSKVNVWKFVQTIVVDGSARLYKP